MPVTTLWAVYTEDGELKKWESVIGSHKFPCVYLTHIEAEVEQAAFKGETVKKVKL